jgi:magnesium transporter
MKKFMRKTGMQPGSLVYTGKKKPEHVKINYIQYNGISYSERNVTDVHECFPPDESYSVNWIDIKALNDLNTIENTGKLFDIHPLVLEDILNTNQRPKIEFLDKTVFIVLKMLSYNEPEDHVEAEQISIVLGNNYVITFQENEEDIFDNLRESMRKNKGHIRTMGADFLAYSLLDTIVDYYYILLERTGQKIEDYEELLLNDAGPGILKEIYILKRENLVLRKSVWPLREVISKIERADAPLLREPTQPFIRDLQDHTTIVIETVDTYMEMISNLVELFLSIGNNRMNEVMKILTIISTIFIPLTFIAGVYGMNFINMPETEWKWGYFMILALMLVIGLAMVYFFRKRRWL